MSVLAGVLEDLRTMSLLQLLLAFAAGMGYVLAQGGLLGRTGRRVAWALAFLGAAGFVLMNGEWTNAIVLVAIAIAGLGSFTALAWLTSWLIGIDPPSLPAPTADVAAEPTRPALARALTLVG